MARTPNPNGAAQPTDEPLLRTVGLTRHFRLGGMFSKRILHAVDDFTIDIHEREIVALVGESGSGKSTVARLLARIYQPTGGEIYYRGRAIKSLRRRKDLMWYRGEVPIVFQDPYSAFHPVFRISHGVMRNLAVKHKLILADEPVSMLDVSIRAGLLNMMTELREQEGVSILYITHDLASARYVADRIVVMYAGHLVETGPTEAVLSDPKHPYTQLLLSAVAAPREKAAQISADSGEPPKVINPTEGCRFRWRCPYAIEVCSQVTPRPSPIGPSLVACHVAVREAEGAPSATKGEVSTTA